MRNKNEIFTLSVNPWRMLRHFSWVLAIGWHWKNRSGCNHGCACLVWTMRPILLWIKCRLAESDERISVYGLNNEVYQLTCKRLSHIPNRCWSERQRDDPSPFLYKRQINKNISNMNKLWNLINEPPTANDVECASRDVRKQIDAIFFVVNHILVRFG